MAKVIVSLKIAEGIEPSAILPRERTALKHGHCLGAKHIKMMCRISY